MAVRCGGVGMVCGLDGRRQGSLASPKISLFYKRALQNRSSFAKEKYTFMEGMLETAGKNVSRDAREECLHTPRSHACVYYHLSAVLCKA